MRIPAARVDLRHLETGVTQQALNSTFVRFPPAPAAGVGVGGQEAGG